MLFIIQQKNWQSEIQHLFSMKLSFGKKIKRDTKKREAAEHLWLQKSS
jgi:hypothetical protein